MGRTKELKCKKKKERMKEGELKEQRERDKTKNGGLATNEEYHRQKERKKIEKRERRMMKKSKNKVMKKVGNVIKGRKERRKEAEEKNDGEK